MRSNKILAFWLLTINVYALKCKVAVNGARVYLVRNQVVVMDFIRIEKLNIA